jgi:hypothetical protein
VNRTPVQSSQIKSVGHNPATNEMEVEFGNGSVYRYRGVDAAKHKAMMESPSIGSHFHANIKNLHVAEKVSGD